MIIHDVEQGTLDWMLLRLGLPTASQFDRLITPKTRKPSTAAANYRADLLAEWLMGHPIEWGSNGWMDRGTWMEKEAFQYYELNQNVDVVKVGFITSDDGSFGGSPDGLVGDDGGVELKVPNATMHTRYLLGLEPDYFGQCQGYMYLTGRKWWDLLSYNPSLPPVIYRLQRDESYIAALEPVLREFCKTVEADKHKHYLYRVKGPDPDYAPLEDDELHQIQRELTSAEAEGLVDEAHAQRVLSALMEGRWREVRRARDDIRRRFLEGPPLSTPPRGEQFNPAQEDLGL